MFSSKLSGFGNRTLLVAVVAALAVVGVAGYLAGVPGDVPVAHALCGGAYNCAGGDLTATSALTVAHAKQIDPYTLQPVEPNDGDTWAITARWSTDTGAACPCADIAFAAVAADVTWSDASGWSVSCTGCAPTTGPIRSVSICPVDGCGAGQDIDNAWSYKLLVDIDHTFNNSCPLGGPVVPGYLSRVNYTTTVVDNGNLIDDVNCSEGSAATPTSQTWTVNDDGAFECGVSCGNSGPGVVILYQ